MPFINTARPSCETLWIVDSRLYVQCAIRMPYACIPSARTEDKSVWNWFILFMFLVFVGNYTFFANVCIFHGTWNSFLCCIQRNNGKLYHILSYHMWYAKFADWSNTHTHTAHTYNVHWLSCAALVLFIIFCCCCRCCCCENEEEKQGKNAIYATSWRMRRTVYAVRCTRVNLYHIVAIAHTSDVKWIHECE